MDKFTLAMTDMAIALLIITGDEFIAVEYLKSHPGTSQVKPPSEQLFDSMSSKGREPQLKAV